MFCWCLCTQIKSVSTLQILLQEKLAGAFKYKQDHLTAGALPRTPLGELAVLPETPQLMGRLATSPRKPHSRFRPFTSRLNNSGMMKLY